MTGGTGGTADSAGDVINYTIAVQNTGNVTLTGVTVTDPFADAVAASTRGADAVGTRRRCSRSARPGSYTATHTVTQAEIDPTAAATARRSTEQHRDGGLHPDRRGHRRRHRAAGR